MGKRTKTKAFAYLRVSSAGQLDGHGLEIGLSVACYGVGSVLDMTTVPFERSQTSSTSASTLPPSMLR